MDLPITKKVPIPSDMEAKWLGQHDGPTVVSASGSPVCRVPVDSGRDGRHEERHLKWLGKDTGGKTQEEKEEKELLKRDQASTSLREAWTYDDKWETEAAALLEAPLCVCRESCRMPSAINGLTSAINVLSGLQDLVQLQAMPTGRSNTKHQREKATADKRSYRSFIRSSHNPLGQVRAAEKFGQRVSRLGETAAWAASSRYWSMIGFPPCSRLEFTFLTFLTFLLPPVDGRPFRIVPRRCIVACVRPDPYGNH